MASCSCCVGVFARKDAVLAWVMGLEVYREAMLPDDPDDSDIRSSGKYIRGAEVSSVAGWSPGPAAFGIGP